MPIEIVFAIMIVLSIFGIALMFQAESRIFAAMSLIIVGGLLQWTDAGIGEHTSAKEELVDTLQVYELKDKDQLSHVIYYEDKVLVLEKELGQEIKAKQIQIFRKPSNFYCGLYFSPKTTYVQKD